MARPREITPLGTSAYVHMAMVAKSGFGKTMFAGTAPKALFLTTDPEGTLSASDVSDADEWVMRDYKDIEAAYRWLRDEGHKQYDWVIVDNITEAQGLGMEEALAKAVAKNPARDKFVPDKLEYQRTQLALVAMVKEFHRLPMNVLWTAHRVGMEDGDAQEYYSAAIQGGQGKIAEQVLGYMNIISFGEVKEIPGAKEGGPTKTVRRQYFSHLGPYRGKDRFKVLGRYRDDMTIPEMMGLIGPKATGNKATPAARPAARKTAAKRVAVRRTPAA